jgi:hypothetical protein
MSGGDGLFPALDAAERAQVAAAFARKDAIVSRLREREADFTPRLVARAVVEAVLRLRIHKHAGVTSLVGSEFTAWPAIGLAKCKAWIGGFIIRGDDAPDSGDGGPFIEVADGRRRVIHVLDICAGAGVFASEIRRFAALLGFEVHITAVDYEPDELPNLVRHADEVIIGDWHTALGMVQDELGVWVWGPDGKREFDLIIGNPAFSQARAATRPEWPRASGPPKKPGGQPTVTRAEAKERKRLADLAVAAGEYPERAEYDPSKSMPALCLECAPAVVLYATQQCYTKTSSGWLTRIDYPYTVVYEVPSSIGHRGRGEGQDDKPYSAFMWLRGCGEPSSTFMLRPISDRNWDERPGAESDEWLKEQGIPLRSRE